MENASIAFDKRLLILSGKGGVGKTSVAIALGLKAAEQGLNTILCEVGENEKIAPLFGKEESRYVERDLGVPGLHSIYIDPHQSFAEFARSRLKVAALWKPLVESKLINSFIQAAPGMKEILMLGKVMELERAKNRDGTHKYDLVILDAPATGHGLSMLRSPILAMRATRAGPIYQKAKLVVDLLQDPARTRMHIVTLAEEMPVTETLEMIQAIRDDIHTPLGAVIANAVVAPVIAEANQEAFRAVCAQSSQLQEGDPLRAVLSVASLLEGRSRLNAEYLTMLRERIDLPLRVLPYFFDATWDIDSLHRLATTLR